MIAWSKIEQLVAAEEAGRTDDCCAMLLELFLQAVEEDQSVAVLQHLSFAAFRLSKSHKHKDKIHDSLRNIEESCDHIDQSTNFLILYSHLHQDRVVSEHEFKRMFDKVDWTKISGTKLKESYVITCLGKGYAQELSSICSFSGSDLLDSYSESRRILGHAAASGSKILSSESYVMDAAFATCDILRCDFTSVKKILGAVDRSVWTVDIRRLMMSFSGNSFAAGRVRQFVSENSSDPVIVPALEKIVNEIF